MPHEFEVSDVIPAKPQAIFDAWLHADSHRDMTGTTEARITPGIGKSFTVWDGYITGKNLTLEPAKRIVQSWRTTEFTDADEDSQIEVLLEETKAGTKVTLRHTNVPDGHTSYEQGWHDCYFKPMKTYFAAVRSGT